MPNTVLILGGYGLIGSAIYRRCRDAGHRTIGMGRNRAAAEIIDRAGTWRIADLANLTVTDWQAQLSDIDVVVNAAGALQDGAKDDLYAIHQRMVERLCEAAHGTDLRVIQISAAGVSSDASTAFFRTKAAGDAALMASGLRWTILKPTLVLSPEPYGGTALLRAAAALPGIQPDLPHAAQVQTVHVDDLAGTVLWLIDEAPKTGLVADITEGASRSFPELLTETRRWLGLSPARYRVRLPGWLMALSSRIADGLGHLGWRSPLRSTALRALADGVTGDPRAWKETGGPPLRTLAESFRDMPATRSDRLFARCFVALPLAIVVLSLFWIASGCIALLYPASAMQVLTERGGGDTLAGILVYGGAFADVILGFAILWRRWARAAALGMIALSAGYLGGSVIAAPDLWADPLGPMVKVFPGMALAGFVWLLMEPR